MLLLSALAALGCQDQTTPTSPLADARASISDGAHNGQQHFYFLSPLVPAPAYNGTFDATLSPVVRICEWQGSACGAQVAEFSMTSGSGSEVVRVDARAEHYVVNWHTDRFALDPAKTYRIRVLVAGSELGHADVKPVSSGKELKNVDANQYIALLNGRTLPIKFRIEEGALGETQSSALIGPEGGTVGVPGLAEFYFPKSFFETPRTVETSHAEDAAAMERFSEFEGLFRVGSRTSYQVRLLAGSTPAQGESFNVVISVPLNLTIPAGHRPELFAQVHEDSGMEVLDNFQLFSSAYDPVARTLTATLPVWVLSDARRSDGLYEALFMIGTTPGGVSSGAPGALHTPSWSVSATDVQSCKAGFIGRPVANNFDVTSPYG